MTTPAEPATGAEAAPATGSDPTPQPAPTQPATGDWSELIQQFESDGLVPNQVTERLKASRKNEERAKTNRRELEELRSQMRPAEGEPTFEDLQAQLTEHRTARDAAEARAVEMAYQTTVGRIAGQLNLDSEALLDSGAFRDAVAEELDDDFDDDDLKAAVSKVGKQFAKQPRFAKTLGASRSGGEFPGGPTSPASIDQQIAEAQKAGDHGRAIALKRHRAAMTQQ